MGRFIPFTGHEDEESYTLAPVPEVPEFTVTVRPVIGKKYARIARKKGLTAGEQQDMVALTDTRDETCAESLIDWSGTHRIWKDDPEDGLPVTPENTKKMAERLCLSMREVVDVETGKNTFKSLWMLAQEHMNEQREFERKN